MDQLKAIFDTFGIEWWRFIAQCLLFLILYTVLKKKAFGPIVDMLEQRRRRIEEGQKNVEKIQQQLAEAEAHYKEIIGKANTEAQKLIDEAHTSAAALSEKKAKEALAEAERIIAKANEATTMERDRLFAELKREVGRLVVDTTARVTGKVLTADDQRRLSEEAAREIAA
ncbi:MAG: F0F1 ATP synthase subunit B [Chthoniobacteraceae bacterium]